MTETLATDAAEVRLLPTVDPHVLPQCCPARGAEQPLKKATQEYIWFS